MTRVKRGKISVKKRRKILKGVKGFYSVRKKRRKAAKEALIHSLSDAFVGRKLKKRDFRRLWQTKIKAAVNQEGLSYSKFMNLLKKNNIKLNRKILADLAENHQEIFKEVVSQVKEG